MARIPFSPTGGSGSGGTSSGSGTRETDDTSGGGASDADAEISEAEQERINAAFRDLEDQNRQREAPDDEPLVEFGSDAGPDQEPNTDDDTTPATVNPRPDRDTSPDTGGQTGGGADTGGGGGGLTDAQQQDIDSALFEGSASFRRSVQGVETADSEVGRQAARLESEFVREFNQRRGNRGRSIDEEDVRIDRMGDSLSAELQSDVREDFGANPSRRDVRRDVAARNEGVSEDDLEVSRGDDGGFNVSLTDEAILRRARGQVADATPGVDASEVRVRRDESGGFDVSLTDEGLEGYRRSIEQSAPTGARRAAAQDFDVASDEFRIRQQVAEEFDGITADDLDTTAETELRKGVDGTLRGETTFTVGLTDEAAQARARRRGRQRATTQEDDGGAFQFRPENIDLDPETGPVFDSDLPTASEAADDALGGTDDALRGVVEGAQSSARGTLADIQSGEFELTAPDFGSRERGAIGTAALAGVAAPEPVSTAGGALVLGGLAVGALAADAGVFDRASELEVPDQSQREGELPVAEPGIESELDVGGGFDSELQVTESPAFGQSEVSVEDADFGPPDLGVLATAPALIGRGIGEFDGEGRTRDRQSQRERDRELEEILQGPDEAVLGEQEPVNFPGEEIAEPEVVEDTGREFVPEREFPTGEDAVIGRTNVEEDFGQQTSPVEQTGSEVAESFGQGVGQGISAETVVPAGLELQEQAETPGFLQGSLSGTFAGQDLGVGQLETGVQAQAQAQALDVQVAEGFATPTANANPGEFAPEFDYPTDFGFGEGGGGRPRRPRGDDFDLGFESADLDFPEFAVDESQYEVPFGEVDQTAFGIDLDGVGEF